MRIDRPFVDRIGATGIEGAPAYSFTETGIMATTSNKFLKAVKKHPVGAAAIVGGTVAGAVLIGKAANTAARLVTIKVAADAATEVAKAIRGPAKRKVSLFGGAGRTVKSAKKRKP